MNTKIKTVNHSKCKEVISLSMKITVNELQNKFESTQNDIIKNEDSRKWYEVLFGKWMHTERLHKILELREELNTTNEAIETAKNIRQNSSDRHIEAVKIREKHEKDLTSNYNNIEEAKKAANTLIIVLIQKLNQ